MTRMTVDKPRDIIDDFAAEIDRTKEDPDNPQKVVIFFRRDHIDKKERKVWLVKTELLRFRKDNGRIASEVQSYENLNRPLTIKEDEEESQALLREFLANKDREKTEELEKSLSHSGQREPAIITCDGFLINGNRRKLALENLHEKTKKEDYKWMRVVILPGKNDPGGPPTLLEIEQVENRYQLQTEGKAEYYNFDRALSIRRKIKIGMSLEEQLRDDPAYAALPEKAFKSEMAKFKKEYLNPLECVDEYLELVGADGLYNAISRGVSDREGRWQAFIDYSHFVQRKLSDPKHLADIELDEEDIGKAKEIAFKLIRQRSFPDIKVHKLMRDYTKLLKDSDARKELFALNHIDMIMPDSIEQNARDREWSKKNSSEIINRVKKARNILNYKKEKEEPIDILENVLEKLQEEVIQPQNLSITDLQKALRLAEQIRDVSDQLKKDYWACHKENTPEAIKNRLQNKYKTG